jgi:hypothetical protein
MIIIILVINVQFCDEFCNDVTYSKILCQFLGESLNYVKIMSFSNLILKCCKILLADVHSKRNSGVLIKIRCIVVAHKIY